MLNRILKTLKLLFALCGFPNFQLMFWASTVLTDVNFLAQPFKTTLAGEFTHRLSLFNSLLSNGNNYITPGPGYTQAVPKWGTLSGSSVQITTSTTTTINNFTDFLDVGIWMEREKAWGADEILMTVAGSDKDVTREVARQIAEYWAGEVHRLSIIANGAIFGTTLAASHVFNDTGNTINIPGVLGAKQKLGDNMDMLKAIVLNSKVYSDAIKDKVANYDKAMVDTYATGETRNILGMAPFVTDKLTDSAGVYPAYLGLPGSMIYMSRPRPSAAFNNANKFLISTNAITVDVELNRIATTGGGQDQLISRASLLVHVPGVKWDTTSVASNPTDVQLATGSNWSKVAPDDKLIKLVQYLSA